MLLQVDNTTSKCVLMINYITQYIQYEMPWIQLTSHTLHKNSELAYNILFCSLRQLTMTKRQCFPYTMWQQTYEIIVVVTICTTWPSTEKLSTKTHPWIRSYWKFIAAVTGRANMLYNLKNIILQCMAATQKYMGSTNWSLCI